MNSTLNSHTLRDKFQNFPRVHKFDAVTVYHNVINDNDDIIDDPSQISSSSMHSDCHLCSYHYCLLKKKKKKVDTANRSTKKRKRKK